MPARGGSKSIPLKNIKEIAGKPLVCWVLEAAINCDQIAKVYLSTDSDLIGNVGQSLNHEKLEVISRSPDTATDYASTESVMIEFANSHDFENIILIQATSPLLTSKELEEAISIFEREKADSLLSVVEQKRFMWKLTKENFVRPLNYDPKCRPRRQDFNGALIENGAFYITKKNLLLEKECRISGKITYYKMPEETYYEIDELHDWIIVENLLLQRSRTNISKEKNDIKLFLMDVDGVLTDAGMYYTEKGDELKKFNTHDGKGIELLRQAGIKTGIITSENTKIVENRARKLKIDHLHQGVKDKLTVAKEICKKEEITLSEVAYIGDDVNDTELLKKVGVAACPINSLGAVKEIPNIIKLQKSGGNGAVRELVDIILCSGNSINTPFAVRKGCSIEGKKNP